MNQKKDKIDEISKDAPTLEERLAEANRKIDSIRDQIWEQAEKNVEEDRETWLQKQRTAVKRPTTPAESLKESMKQMKLIQEGKLPKKTWWELRNKLKNDK
ncbi:hypothetical protein O9H85_08255 [Paenibacillus filicis]|uniref:Uncharacterized protein n=1 Tax=Paenibacillus gyeongsangnamensis TaxID=3388067 RepID=A0ABT4Q6U4_9BACL|nr:hypothetical protein [Paenibacillus filicis]MCZ8512425.1 hypothetical protein [Paenibacillus filicis]